MKCIKILISSLFVVCLNGHGESVFPEDCWGVYSWGGGKEVTRASHPLIKGVPLIYRWSELEPEVGKFRFDDEITPRLEQFARDGHYTFLMIWVAPRAPRWLYENGVPELEMTPTINPLGVPRNWTFQYYLDEDYIRFYHRLLTEFGNYMQRLPSGLRDRVLYIQSAEGSTGDGWGYKGKPMDLKYDITDEQWGKFRIQAWEVLKAALTDKQGNVVTPILVNYDSNREKQYQWVLNNLRVIGLKNGMFSHGYHISDTKKRIHNWELFKKDVQARGKEFFSRGEQDAEYRTYGWSTQNIPQALYWSAIFATHCGLNMWNVPWQACEGDSNRDAVDFFNKYAGHFKASTAPVAFCALRQGLDASDTIAYPEIDYGEADKGNIDRYLNIAAAFKGRGAIQGDPSKAIGGGMINRKRQDYNDVGWGIHDGNYYRFLDQIDPDSTSIGWWHKGPKESIYSRFSRSTDVRTGKQTFYFDLDDEFLPASSSVKVKIVWLDEGKAEWKLLYNAPGQAEKSAFTMKNRNSGQWLEKTVRLDDFRPQNKGRMRADLLLECDGNEDLFVHLLEVEK